MNPCDGRNTDSYLWGPVFQTWEPPQTRYHSPFEYICDPTATKVVQLWNSKKREGEYSSRKKAYYSVVPNNTKLFDDAPVMNFDFTRLKQTDVMKLVYSRSPAPHQFGIVSLADTISPLLNKMGMMKDPTTGENLGTCTLIAHNLVLVARHAVEGRNIRSLTVIFGYKEFSGSFYDTGRTSFNCIIEENISCDYAIIQLKESLGSRLGFVSLNIEDHTLSEPALLHYPLGKPLKVSVHAFVETECQNQTNHLLVYHDSDYFSSGGAYFDPMGRMIAMHVGAKLQGETMNLLRYALSLEMVVKQNPRSLLRKLARGELPQAHSYTASAALTYLCPTNHNYLIDEEGRESEKILRGLLTNELKIDKQIKKTKNEAISFSTSNLEYIAKTYPTKYHRFKQECVGKTGLHKFTRLFSVTGVIESDHTIPHYVWKSTTNRKMRAVAVGEGKRPGENDMPAITLPCSIHRNLLTTGSSAECQAFHKSLIKLCNNNEIDQALIKCYQDYKDKGLNLATYKNKITQSLGEHVKLGLISETQKLTIIDDFLN